MDFLASIWAWIVARFGEPTTWDGFVLIGIGIVMLLFEPLVDIAAWVAIGYGLFRVFKKEVEPRL